MRPLAVVGNLSLDRVDDGEPRPGGAPFHGARALRVLGRPAIVAVKAAETDRRRLLPPLVRLGLPVLWRSGSSTASFAFSYDGDRRAMLVEELGPSWTADDLRGLERAEWVHVGALARSDFPAGTMAALARGGRKLALDGQGLVRPERPGPLVLDADYDPAVVRHVSVLKLSEEEAHTVAGEELDEESLGSLGVPEVVVTLGSRGSLVLAEGQLERVPARPVDGDPTGAGDSFLAAYLVSRAAGYAPVASARRATAVVAGLLGQRL